MYNGWSFRLKQFPYIHNLLRAFIMKDCWIFWNMFLNGYDHIFFFCSLLMWYNTVRDFWLMNQQKIPGHSVWLFLYIVEFFLLISCVLWLCSWEIWSVRSWEIWSVRSLAFKVCLILVKIGETESLEGTGMGEMPFSQLVLSSCKVISPTE